jgi:cell division septum initiation protein DivIVA
MTPDWLTELRNKVSDETYLEIIQYLDRVASDFESLKENVNNLEGRADDLEDRTQYMTRALRLIAQTQPTEEGANMAKGIAEEAISAVGV